MSQACESRCSALLYRGVEVLPNQMCAPGAGQDLTVLQPASANFRTNQNQTQSVRLGRKQPSEGDQITQLAQACRAQGRQACAAVFTPRASNVEIDWNFLDEHNVDQVCNPMPAVLLARLTSCAVPCCTSLSACSIHCKFAAGQNPTVGSSPVVCSYPQNCYL